MSLIELFFAPIFFLINSFFSLIPRFSFPASFDSALMTGQSWLATVGFFLPLSAVSDIAVCYIAFYFIKLFFLNFEFMAKRIPFIKH